MNGWKKDFLTIPNMLSLLRLILIPFYITIYQNASSTKDYILAASILAASCLTDLIDGKIARYYNMTTTAGKILDPLADKATQFTLILCLSSRHKIISYMVALFIIKELFQLTAGYFAMRNGRILCTALFSGKLCTTVLFISLIAMVLMPSMPPKIIKYTVIIDIGFMLVSFGDYISAYLFNNSRFETIEKPRN